MLFWWEFADVGVVGFAVKIVKCMRELLVLSRESISNFSHFYLFCPLPLLWRCCTIYTFAGISFVGPVVTGTHRTFYTLQLLRAMYFVWNSRSPRLFPFLVSPIWLRFGTTLDCASPTCPTPDVFMSHGIGKLLMAWAVCEFPLSTISHCLDL